MMALRSRKKSRSLWQVLFLALLMLLSNSNSNGVVFTDLLSKDGDTGNYHSPDGTGNNEENPSWGAAHTPRVRFLPSAATEGDNGASLPSARRIMEDLFRKAPPRVPKASNHLLLELGHFIAHDILGQEHSNKLNYSDPMPIPCDGQHQDWVFCPITKRHYNLNSEEAAESEEASEIEFWRTQHTTTGSRQRATINRQTSYLDLSNMYGITSSRQAQLRSFQDGKLYLDAQGMPPLLEDYRNLSPGVFSIYVVFLRYHNYVASELQAKETEAVEAAEESKNHLNTAAGEGWGDHGMSKRMTDEELFLKARQKTIAVYQSIVEQKYIPMATGKPLPTYEGYNPSTDPSVDEFFAAVAFRYGHSSFSNVIRMIGAKPNWQPLPDSPLLLRDVVRSKFTELFLQEDYIQHLVLNKGGGIEAFLRGLTLEAVRASDATIIDDFNLFSSLSMVDVQRARDVGIPSYNQVRRAIGLAPLQSFEELVYMGRESDASIPLQEEILRESWQPQDTSTNGSDDDDDNDDADTIILQALKSLYENDIDRVDAYVGALVEKPSRKEDPLGELHFRSTQDQFQRLRDGDRMWYGNIYEPQEYQEFPTISEIIRLVCDDMEDFPSDAFRVWNGPNQYQQDQQDEEKFCSDTANHISLLSGKFNVKWSTDLHVPTAVELREEEEDADSSDDSPESPQWATSSRFTIDVTLTAMSPMNGPGFLGIGWRSREMKGAEMWFCNVDEDALDEYYANSNTSLPSTCDDDAARTATRASMFSCCLAETTKEGHGQPICADSMNKKLYYELEVVDWCLSDVSSSVTIRAPVCEEEGQHSVTSSLSATSRQVGQEQEEGSMEEEKPIICFRLSSTEDNRMDLIVAYNPYEVASHGYMRRSAAQIDLTAGIIMMMETETAVDEGIIATHGVYMLLAWMVVAPAAIYIVRYLKVFPHRLEAHVLLMAFLGALMIPLLIGFQVSLASSDKSQDHSIVGLILMVHFMIMALAGIIRLKKQRQGNVGKGAELFSYVVHKIGGYVFVGVAWWNCWTGLVRIGPTDSNYSMALTNSTPLGYNMSTFGFIREYLFVPYILLVCAIFAHAELQRWRGKNSSHAQEIREGIVEGIGGNWDDLPDNLEEFTQEDFLRLTRFSALCIVDGYVLDVSNFADYHPGGRHLLRFAKGADITYEFVGLRAVDGIKNRHSREALKVMKTLIKGVMVDENEGGKSSRTNLLQEKLGHNAPRSRKVPAAFQFGRIVDFKYLTKGIGMTSHYKPVVLVSMSLPEDQKERLQLSVNLPGCAMTFRSNCNKTGQPVERQYTPVAIRSSQLENQLKHQECTFDFIISLVPGGKMSAILLDLQRGRSLLTKGPEVNPLTIKTFEKDWQSIVMIASGTGIANMLQVIEYYLAQLENDNDHAADSIDASSTIPRMYLIWLIKGPDFDYGKSLDLEELVERSRGMFRYTVLYPARNTGTSRQTSQTRSNNRYKSLADDWDFQSLAESENAKRKWPGAGFKRESVKQMVLQNSIPTNKNSTLDVAQKSGVPTKGRGSDTVTVDLSSSTAAMLRDDDEESFSRETWLAGLTQYRYREFNGRTLREVLESIDSDVKAKNDVNKGRQRTDEEEEEKEEEDYYQSEEERSVGEDAVIATEMDFSKRLVAISGTPAFEYETQQMLGGIMIGKIGLPEGEMVTFHGQKILTEGQRNKLRVSIQATRASATSSGSIRGRPRLFKSLSLGEKGMP